MGIKTRTFSVLGTAYVDLDRGILTHACESDKDGFAEKVVCGNVKLENICNDLVDATDEAPTCKACLKKLKGKKYA